MKNYRDSDYAANKYASGIVYRFADRTVEVTVADYLRENPGKTEADFAELKLLSDELFLQLARSDAAQGKKVVCIHGLENTLHTASISPEEIVIDVPERAATEAQKQELAEMALRTLTTVQLRRYTQHKVNGLSTREIAALECTNHKSVHESLQAAEKKIKKFLESV